MDTLVDNGEIKQIIVITERVSDVGASAIEAAGKVYDSGIIISSIGIIDSRSGNDERQIKEVEKLARAGGGLCEFSCMEDLDETVQKIVLKTARRITEQIINRQLKAVIGERIEDLEVKSRIKLVDFIEKYGDNINLKCVLVLDTSESMRGRVGKLKKSAMKLYEILRDRRGRSSIAVIEYPGENNDSFSVICDFTGDISILGQNTDMKYSDSAVHAAPAIYKAFEMIQQHYGVRDSNISEYH